MTSPVDPPDDPPDGPIEPETGPQETRETEAPKAAPEPESPPPKAGLWSRLSATAGKVAAATRDAAGKVAHVTAEVAKETVSVAQKGATESANMAKHAYEHFDEVRDQTGAAFAKVGRTVSETTIGVAQSASKTIATASTDAIKALVKNINETLPYIERAGYRVSEIELGLSVPPRVLMHLTLGPELSDEVREALLQDCEGKWFTRQIIERLHNIRQIQRATQFQGMAFDEIEIEIALIPSVLLHYRKIHRNVALPVETPLADAAQAAEAAAASSKSETRAPEASVADESAREERTETIAPVTQREAETGQKTADSEGTEEDKPKRVRRSNPKNENGAI